MPHQQRLTGWDLTHSVLCCKPEFFDNILFHALSCPRRHCCQEQRPNTTKNVIKQSSGYRNFRHLEYCAPRVPDNLRTDLYQFISQGRKRPFLNFYSQSKDFCSGHETQSPGRDVSKFPGCLKLRSCSANLFLFNRELPTPCFLCAAVTIIS